METSTVPYALAVDDDPIILMDIGGILEDAGFRVHETDNGDAAMTMLPANARNIILLFSDVEMPGGTNGFALARHVAEHYPWIEIVIASGRIKPMPGDMPDKATFISKPFTAQMVHNHLRETLPDGKKPEPLQQAVR
ncbi:response regulator [Sphingomonas sp.]|uniref:response regulator n=1 Tax=Sphingomonas sp. TaxID=28214 RepID=UPI0028A05743|nr:response regulator [Sphingomonas sp.]